MKAKYLLIGNPNVGKTSLFNQLCNSYETVGNFTGVTVEKKIGDIKAVNAKVVDLPGTYEVTPTGLDEGVTTTELLANDHNGIINVVDSTSLKRNLMLTLDLLESDYSMVVLLNMYDEFNKLGKSINIDKLRQKLGIDVFPIVATKGVKTEEIIKSVKSPKNKIDYDYPEYIKQGIKEMKEILPHNKVKRNFLAIQLLVKNDVAINYARQFNKDEEIQLIIDKVEQSVKENTSFNSTKSLIKDIKASYINKVLKDCEHEEYDYNKIEQSKHYKVDKLLYNNIVGIPIFLLILTTIYYITFNLIGDPLSGLLEKLFYDIIQPIIETGLSNVGITGATYSLLIDGVYTGITSIAIFLPQIIIMFFFIHLLESIGYMSRVSVMFDKSLVKVGINGKSILPLITGLGCNVPAVMATRTIENKKERIITLLIVPFMSCAARLPIYVVFVNVFFGKLAFLGLIIMQIFTALVAILVALVLNISVFKSNKSGIVLEIPPYRKPQLKYLLRVTYVKGKKFLKTVFFIMTIGTIIIWALSNFGLDGFGVHEDESILALITKKISVIFKPLGFGTWEATSAIISGFAAKEAIVSTLAVLYDTNNLQATISEVFTFASGLSFLVFNALYIPCLATVAVIKKETGSAKWMWFSILLNCVTAYIFALIVYQLAGLFS